MNIPELLKDAVPAIRSDSTAAFLRFTYDPIYFEADKQSGPILFVSGVLDYVTARGKARTATGRSPIEFANVGEMVAAIETHNMTEAQEDTP